MQYYWIILKPLELPYYASVPHENLHMFIHTHTYILCKAIRIHTYITCISVSSESIIEAAFLPASSIFLWFKAIEVRLHLNAFNHCVLEGAM